MIYVWAGSKEFSNKESPLGAIVEIIIAYASAEL
jgi:hypothetical protein